MSDPQTRAADMMASFFWAHSPEYVDHVAAKLAEAGLLADPEERSRLIAAHQKAARFADQNYEQWQKAEVERDAARAELAEVKAEREKWETRYRKVIGERNRETERAKKAEAELAALREGVRALAGDMRSRELDPWYWSEIADEIDALLGEDQ